MNGRPVVKYRTIARVRPLTPLAFPTEDAARAYNELVASIEAYVAEHWG